MDILDLRPVSIGLESLNQSTVLTHYIKPITVLTHYIYLLETLLTHLKISESDWKFVQTLIWKMFTPNSLTFSGS